MMASLRCWVDCSMKPNWFSKIKLCALDHDSKKFGSQGEELDFSLLLDGLQAEREQGITIDVAYRFFATEKRRFIVADTPGHEQYTRNMATGASTAEAAVLLVDARKGLLVQTQRHSRIVAMFGVRHIALAINKMDLVEGSEDQFRKIEGEFREFAGPLGFASITAIPTSALKGQNVVATGRSELAWYTGPTLLQWLESVPLAAQTDAQKVDAPFCMAVQSVTRSDSDFRGFAGRVATGSVRPGDGVRISPSGLNSRIKDIVAWGGNRARASVGESVLLVLGDAVDVSRGDVIAAEAHPVEASDQFQAVLLWMSDDPLLPGRPYGALIHTKSTHLTVTDIRHRIEISTGRKLAAKTIGLNEIATVNISFDRRVPFLPYLRSRKLGAFIITDRWTNETVGVGMIRHALRRASNVHWQALEVTKAARAALSRQRARCLWFTGLSGSGKTTIANLLEKRLHANARLTYILDGDNVRHGLNRDLGFTAADRVENIRRVAEVVHLMVDAGLIVIVAFISPFRAEREFARSLFEEGEFVEVFVNTPIEECERRDTKGLYAKARRGELKNFTGIDSRYEVPERPELVLTTIERTPEHSVEQIVRYLDD